MKADFIKITLYNLGWRREALQVRRQTIHRNHFATDGKLPSWADNPLSIILCVSSFTIDFIYLFILLLYVFLPLK